MARDPFANAAAETSPVSYTTQIKDPRADALLTAYYESVEPVRRIIYKAVLAGGLPGKTVREFKKTHPAFAGIYDFAYDNLVRSAIDAAKTWRELLAYRRNKQTVRIKDLGEKLDRTRNPARKEGLTRSLAAARKRLRKVEWLRTKLPYEGTNYPLGVEIRFDGRAREKFGCDPCRWDGEKLIIKSPFAGGTPILVRGVKFAAKLTGKKPYANGEPRATKIFPRLGPIPVDKPLNWRLRKKEDGHWYATVSITPEKFAMPPKNGFAEGAIGLDLNLGSHTPFFAAVAISPDGNLERILPPFSFLPRGSAQNKNEYEIWATVKEIVALARREGRGIAVEDLDFDAKKAYLKKFEHKFRSNMSSWAYAKIQDFLQRECFKEGVYLAKVPPAFTSHIGRKKYVPLLEELSDIHRSAAFVIARRAIGFGRERASAKAGFVFTSEKKDSPKERFSRWKKIKAVAKCTV